MSGVNWDVQEILVEVSGVNWDVQEILVVMYGVNCDVQEIPVAAILSNSFSRCLED